MDFIDTATKIAQTGAVGIALVLTWILWQTHKSFMAYIDRSNARQDKVLKELSDNIHTLNDDLRRSHEVMNDGIKEVKNLFNAVQQP